LLLAVFLGIWVLIKILCSLLIHVCVETGLALVTRPLALVGAALTALSIAFLNDRYHLMWLVLVSTYIYLLCNAFKASW